MIVDYDRGCIVVALEGGKCLSIKVNGAQFAAVSLKLREPEYDMSTLGKKLKEFRDLLRNAPGDNIAPWLKEFIESPRFDDDNDHKKAVSHLLSDVRGKLEAKLGANVASALLPTASNLMAYPTEKIKFEGQYPFPEVNVLKKAPGMILSKDGTEIEFIQEDIADELKIPEGVKIIRGEDLKKCCKITSIKIPKSVTTINNRHQTTFRHCLRLERIEVEKENPVYKSINGMLFNKEGTKLICVPKGMRGALQIPKGVAEIENEVFRDCTGLISIIIPKSVSEIEYRMFCGCSGLTRITLPKSVIKIGWSAFEGCTELKSITIPESVTEIERATFFGCTGLTSITIPESITKIGRYAFWGCRGLKSITIPKGVTEIGEGAFSCCTRLMKITLSKSVVRIGKNIFYGCSELKQLEVAVGNPAYKSVDEMLLDKKGTMILFVTNGKSAITIPMEVNKIGEDAFSVCNGLEHIAVEKGNTTYKNDDGTLFNKTGTEIYFVPRNLKGLYQIPKGIIEIKGSAFANVRGLTSIVLPGSVRIIGISAFLNCTGLTNIKLSKNITEIKECAFRGCSGLTSISIPKSIWRIGRKAFYDCTSLKDIYFEGNAPELEGSSFNSVQVTVYYRKGTKGWGKTFGGLPTKVMP